MGLQWSLSMIYEWVSKVSKQYKFLVTSLVYNVVWKG